MSEDIIAIEFDARVRLRIKRPLEHKQSLYFFNLYRAGSSVMEALAEAVAQVGAFTPVNIVQALDRNGVFLSDTRDFSRESVFLNDDSAALDYIRGLPGCLYYGFREVPQGFGARFDQVGAATLLVRDPRDILYSQYAAVAGHTTEGASGADILKLREQTAQISRDEFVVQDGSIEFARRIVECYRPMIEKGIALLKYEDFFVDGGFSPNTLLEAIVARLGAYLPDDFAVEDAVEQLGLRIANSKSLRGHATGGSFGMFRKLEPGTLDQLNAALAPQLDLLGYEQ